MQHCNEANQTLNELASRESMVRLTRADVDNILWAVRQLDQRNDRLQATLNSSEATLSNDDIRGLEESVEAIRKLYSWVAAARLQPREDAAPRETLSSIAADHSVTLRELRDANPHLEDYRATDELPIGVRVRVPTPARREAISTRGSPMRPISSKRTPTRAIPKIERAKSPRSLVVDTNEEVTCISDLAREWKTSTEEIVRQNPELSEFRDEEDLPRGLIIKYHRRDARTPSRRDTNDREERMDDDRDPPPRRVRVGSPRDRVEPTTTPRQRSRFRSDGTECLIEIAKSAAKCSLTVLRQYNPELDDYRDDDILPNGTVVIIPPRELQDRQTRDRSIPRQDGVEQSVEENKWLRTQEGDSLKVISRAEGVSMSLLRGLNPGLDEYREDDVMPARTRVLISTQRDGVPVSPTDDKMLRAHPTVRPPPPPLPAGGTPVHTVTQEGDTVDGIARHYDIHPQDLVEINPSLGRYRDYERLPLGLDIVIPR